jgi:hypothetical protein
MIEDPVPEKRELTEVVFTAANLIPGSSESKRARTAETLLNVLEGRIRNPNTRNAYKVAWRSFFGFCSEYKLELERVKPFHFGLWLKRHTGSVATIELRHMDRTSIWRLVQARARACGLEKRVCCHSFCATGITEYMSAGGSLDIAPSASPDTVNFLRPKSTTDHRTA